MHSLIFEPTWEGHRLDYVARLLPGLLASSKRVTLALSMRAPESAEYVVHLAPILKAEPKVHVDAWMDYPIPGATPFQAAAPLPKLLRDSIGRSSATWAYVPTVDGMAQLAGMQAVAGKRIVPRGIEVEALLMRGGFAYPQTMRGRLKAEAARFLAFHPAWSALYTIDPLAFDVARRRYGPRSPLKLMPDPVAPVLNITHAEAREALDLPDRGRYIGVVGQIDERKGADLLIRAFAAASLPPEDRLLLVGRHAPGIHKILRGDFEPMVRAGRIISIDRYVEKEDLEHAVAAMDVVSTPYPNHIGSASIVIRAAAAGRPVLGSQAGWIGAIVPRFDLGTTCDVTDIPAFARSIRTALNDAHDHQVSEANRRFVAFHSPDNFTATWASRIRDRQGLPALPGHRDWHWVEESATLATS